MSFNDILNLPIDFCNPSPNSSFVGVRQCPVFDIEKRTEIEVFEKQENITFSDCVTDVAFSKKRLIVNAKTNHIFFKRRLIKITRIHKYPFTTESIV